MHGLRDRAYHLRNSTQPSVNSEAMVGHSQRAAPMRLTPIPFVGPPYLTGLYMHEIRQDSISVRIPHISLSANQFGPRRHMFLRSNVEIVGAPESQPKQLPKTDFQKPTRDQRSIFSMHVKCCPRRIFNVPISHKWYLISMLNYKSSKSLHSCRLMPGFVVLLYQQPHISTF